MPGGAHPCPHPRDQPEGQPIAHPAPGATGDRGEWLWNTPGGAGRMPLSPPLSCASDVSANAARRPLAARLSLARQGRLARPRLGKLRSGPDREAPEISVLRQSARQPGSCGWTIVVGTSACVDNKHAVLLTLDSACRRRPSKLHVRAAKKRQINFVVRPHDHMPGNRYSSIILRDEVRLAFAFVQLVRAFERKMFNRLVGNRIIETF